MLRYKNSLLERILLEKGKDAAAERAAGDADRPLGIDVQAELKTKEESTQSIIAPLSISQPTPAQRAVLNRHHQVQRANSGSSSRLVHAPKSRSDTVSSQSPQLQPTPSSKTSSPTDSRSPIYSLQGGMTSPHTANQAQQQFQQQQQQQQQQQLQSPLRPLGFPSSHMYPSITIPTSNAIMQAGPVERSKGQPEGVDGIGGGPRPRQWSSSYQTHMEQLGKLTRPLLSFFSV